jgi:hypothetical protein
VPGMDYQENSSNEKRDTANKELCSSKVHFIIDQSQTNVKCRMTWWPSARCGA